MSVRLNDWKLSSVSLTCMQLGEVVRDTLAPFSNY